MQPVEAVLPELVCLRRDAEAAPFVADGQLAVGMLALELVDAPLEPLAIRDRAALRRGERAELAAAGAPARVRLGLLAETRVDRPLDADLAAERLPVEQQRRARVRDELAALAAAVVREEDEAALVERLQQDHPQRRRAVGRRGRERHRLGIDRLGRARVLEPAPELGQRVGIELVARERASRAAWTPRARLLQLD